MDLHLSCVQVQRDFSGGGEVYRAFEVHVLQIFNGSGSEYLRLL